MRFAKRSSIRVALVAALVATVGLAAVGLAIDHRLLLAVGLSATAVTAGFLSLHLLASERRRHERIAEALAAQASSLEALVAAIGAITASLDADEILARTRREAERLFDAQARIVPADEAEPAAATPNEMLIPLRARDTELGALHLVRSTSFARGDVARATMLADFAARATENARLVEEARVREAERARLSDQLITAEQTERRRLALFLHDTAVQSLSGIALMLDAGMNAVEIGDLDQAKQVITSALARHRDTIRSLRDLSFALEPVVLRDQGFAPALRALADQIGLAQQIQFDLNVDGVGALSENAQAALYQIIREALHGAIRRGPPTRISINVAEDGEGGVEAVISDDAPGERRRATFDPIAERARTLNGRLDVEHGGDGGTSVRVRLPGYAARQ